MALLIDGDVMSFRAAVYGRPHEETISFLQQQFDDPSRTLNLANNNFIDRSRSVFEDNYSDAAMSRLEAVRRSINRVWDEDVIQPLATAEELQTAKPRMQRWIMANPFVRNLHKQGRVYGYGDSYIDHRRQGIGPDHYDYRLATSGFATFSDEDGYSATTYIEELLPDDVPPTFDEKIDIFETWCHSEHHLLTGRRDITSPEDNEWG